MDKALAAIGVKPSAAYRKRVSNPLAVSCVNRNGRRSHPLPSVRSPLLEKYYPIIVQSARSAQEKMSEYVFPAFVSLIKPASTPSFRPPGGRTAHLEVHHHHLCRPSG